jgi:1-acyl-sn-glycerol-3-phosphate acyltransferase
MISKLIYRCPVCAGFEWLQNARCVHCDATVVLEQRNRLSVNGRSESIAHWYDRIRDFTLPADSRGLIYKSDAVRLSKEVPVGRYFGPGGMTAVLYERRYAETVSAALFQDRIELAGAKSILTVSFETLVSITIESNVIILVDRATGPLFLDFCRDSGKKWEDGIRRALRDYKRPERVVEFFPRILTDRNLRNRPSVSSGWKPPHIPTAGPGRNETHPVYLLARLAVRAILEKWLQIEWAGREHLPRTGAAILLGNHSSFLDAIILEALTPRNIWFMAKNSQYRGRFMTWFLGLARSFPVRRYTVDVQAVRNAIRVVQGGHILGIFPEGERNWDDRMLPFKRGTMRLVLALGVPVIPVGIAGAYGLMPRWTHRVKRVPLHIRLGEPVYIEPVAIAAQTEADIAAVTEKIRGAIQALVKQR